MGEGWNTHPSQRPVTNAAGHRPWVNQEPANFAPANGWWQDPEEAFDRIGAISRSQSTAANVECSEKKRTGLGASLRRLISGKYDSCSQNSSTNTTNIFLPIRSISHTKWDTMIPICVL